MKDAYLSSSAYVLGSDNWFAASRCHICGPEDIYEEEIEFEVKLG